MVNTKTPSFADIVAILEGTAEAVDEDTLDTDVVVSHKPNCTIKRKTKDGIMQTTVTADDVETERKEVLRLLNEDGWTFSDIKSIWRRSRKDAEAVEIISDLTQMAERNIISLLGLTNIPAAADEGIAAYWASRA